MAEAGSSLESWKAKGEQFSAALLRVVKDSSLGSLKTEPTSEQTLQERLVKLPDAVNESIHAWIQTNRDSSVFEVMAELLKIVSLQTFLNVYRGPAGSSEVLVGFFQRLRQADFCEVNELTFAFTEALSASIAKSEVAIQVGLVRSDGGFKEGSVDSTNFRFNGSGTYPQNPKKWAATTAKD